MLPKKKRNWFLQCPVFFRTMSGFSKSGSGFSKFGSGFLKFGSGFLKSGSGFLKSGSGFLKSGSGFLKSGSGFFIGSQRKPSTGLTPARVSEPLLLKTCTNACGFCFIFGNNQHQKTFLVNKKNKQYVFLP